MATMKDLIERVISKLNVRYYDKDGNMVKLTWERSRVKEAINEAIRTFYRETRQMPRNKFISANLYNGFQFYMPNDTARVINIWYDDYPLEIVNDVKWMYEKYGVDWRKITGDPAYAIIEDVPDVQGAGDPIFDTDGKVVIRLFPIPSTYTTTYTWATSTED